MPHRTALLVAAHPRVSRAVAGAPGAIPLSQANQAGQAVGRKAGRALVYNTVASTSLKSEHRPCGHATEDSIYTSPICNPPPRFEIRPQCTDALPRETPHLEHYSLQTRLVRDLFASNGQDRQAWSSPRWCMVSENLPICPRHRVLRDCRRGVPSTL